MSLEVFGDEGDIDEHECRQTENAREAGFEDGWEAALERVALILEGGYPTKGDRADVESVVMSVRAMKLWAKGEPPVPPVTDTRTFQAGWRTVYPLLTSPVTDTKEKE